MNLDYSLETIDLIIVGAYFCFVVALGWYFKGNASTEKNFFLAGRSLMWPVIGFSLFASNIGSITLVGLAESGYSTGFANFSYEWMASLVLVIFAIFFLPFYLKNQVYTIPEFLEKRYGSFARTYFSIITIILNVFIDIAASLFSGALLLRLVFPELSVESIVWGISIVAAFYTFMGGLASVVYTDTVQAVLLLVSSIVLSILAYNEVGGWSEIVAHVDQSMLTIIKPADDPDLPWPSLFAGVFLLGFYFWVTNQFIAQRALASKNTMQGQWGAIFAGFLKLITLFIMVLPGVIALILYPELGNGSNPDLSPKDAYPTLVFNLLPTGLLGLTLAGFTAALMSSVDSGLNAASTLFTMDIYKKWKEKRRDKGKGEADEEGSKETIIVAKITIFALMIVSALWAPNIIKFDSFWDYIQLVLAHICPPVVALFGFGIFTKRVNTQGANAAIITGVVLSILTILIKVMSGAEDASPFWLNLAGFLPHYLYMAGVIFIICSIVLLGVSAMGKEDEGKNWDDLLWTWKHYREESETLSALPFYKNYRFLSLMLVLTIILMLIIF
jgi:SSS family solute:Na+ symporter